MKVKDIMTQGISTVDSNSTISEAAKIMRDYDVGSVPVCEGNRPIGIITDRDIVIRGVSAAIDSGNTTVGDLMSKQLIYGTPEMDIHEAVRIMAENQIRRLPVVENNQIVGMVSLGDIATKSNYMDEASEALSSISLPSRPKK